jgi:hypothetical protein
MKSFVQIKNIILLGLLLCFYPAPGQDIPEINEKDISGLTIKRNDSFDGESLWGYMNGGADIYLEYGFDILRVQEFEGEGENIKLELFKMDNPVSAFGIYSLKTYKCRESNVLTSLDCMNDYQYQLLAGDYYIQLINESGSEQAINLMIDIAGVLLDKLEKSELILPVQYLIDILNFAPEDIKMLMGVLGIQNKASALKDYLKDIDEYQVYYAKRKLEGKTQTYYEIIFRDPEMKENFLNNTDDSLQIMKENDATILCTFFK